MQWLQRVTFLLKPKDIVAVDVVAVVDVAHGMTPPNTCVDQSHTVLRIDKANTK